MNLRPYQSDVIAKVDAAVDAGKRRVLLTSPTGSGKTVIAASIVNSAVSDGRRVLFLAHRRELIAQAHRKLYDLGIDAGIILAGHPPRPLEPIQIASVQTLWARAMRSRSIDLPPADLVVIDECHHARAKTYRRIVESYPDAVVLGLTATPVRGDGRGLGGSFDTIVECPDVATLTEMGFLVPAVVYAPSRPDLKGVQVRRGDYASGQLEKAMDRPSLIGDIPVHYHKHAAGRRTIIFASGVAHSVHIRDELRRSGVMAEHLDGSTPTDERERLLASFAAGDVDVISNVGVLTEGFDLADIGAIILARPTRSLGLYRQMIGRGLRPAADKTDCIILDHAGAVFEHGLPADPVRWTLREDRRAESPRQKARSSGKAPTIATCPECHAVRLQGAPCSRCGWRPRPKPRAVDVQDGDLGRVDASGLAKRPVYTDADKARFHRQLLYIARERDYKPGWAAWKFKEKFGAWPRERNPVPEPPDASVRSWVRSRQIAYARSRKAGAA